eukprot:5883994-Alexandrium_andersonii.AAC.1
MSASLVGSEMCIRDSSLLLYPTAAPCISPRAMPRLSPGLLELCAAFQAAPKRQAEEAPKPEEGP